MLRNWCTSYSKHPSYALQDIIQELLYRLRMCSLSAQPLTIPRYKRTNTSEMLSFFTGSGLHVVSRFSGKDRLGHDGDDVLPVLLTAFYVSV